MHSKVDGINIMPKFLGDNDQGRDTKKRAKEEKKKTPNCTSRYENPGRKCIL
jgi:hypothetical protein